MKTKQPVNESQIYSNEMENMDSARRLLAYKCVLCMRRFDTITKKKSHQLEHFKMEFCTCCEKDLFRIGGNLYTQHNANDKTCIKEELTSQEFMARKTKVQDRLCVQYTYHKCSFCQRILKNTKKNDHEMRHFAQETCMGCNKTLIRIDDDLYTVHNSKTCIKVKSEAFKQEEFDVVEETIDFISRKIKSEPQPNTTGEYDDTHQINATTKTVQTEHELFESEGDILCQTSICVRELQIKTEPIEQNQDTISSDDQSSGPISPQSGYNEMGVQDSLPRNEKLIEKNYLDVESLQLLQSRGHRIRHSKASFYECYLCKFRYKHKISLILHMSYHRDGFECYMCKLEFPIESTLKIHMQRYHDLDRVEIKCELCWRTFDRNSSVQDHLCTRKAIKINKGDAVPCTCCGKIVVCKGSLQRQQTAIHNLSGKILCLICTRKHSIRTHHSRPRNPRR